MSVFQLASSLLNNLDSAAKDVLEEPKVSATTIRAKRKTETNSNPGVVESLPTNSRQLEEGSDEDDEMGSAIFNDQKSQSTNSDVNSAKSKPPPASPHSNSESHGNSQVDESKSVTSLSSTFSGLLASNISVKRQPSSEALNSTSTSNSNNVNEVAELKRSLRKKNQEIEKLNRECLEFEDQNTALKSEVQEAWDHYKQSQERAVAREMELLDEMKEVFQSKSVDKQQYKEEIRILQQEVSLQQQSYQQMMDEKLGQYEEMKKMQVELHSIHLQYEQKIQTLEDEIQELKNNSNSNVVTLRDELQRAQDALQQSQQDSQQFVSNQQKKYTHLEEEYNEMSQLMANMQKEMLKYKQQAELLSMHTSSTNLLQTPTKASQRVTDPSTTTPGQQDPSTLLLSTRKAAGGNVNTGDDYLQRENLSLQHELISLTTTYQTLQNQYETLSTQYQILEKDHKIQTLKYETDKKSYQDQLNKYYLTIQTNETQIKALQQAQHSHQQQSSQSSNQSSSTSQGSDGLGGKELSSWNIQDIQDMKTQLDQLSKMLLAKQQLATELQAERSALKSRVQDLQTRLSTAEEQLAQYKDLEGDGENDDEEESIGIGGGAASRRANGNLSLNRRTGSHVTKTSSSYGSMNEAKVISDLERFGVKPGSGMKNAVTWIDSWAMFTGKILRVYPLARLGFVIYLLVLHLWVMFILVIQTHSLDVLPDPRDRMINP